MTSLVTPGFVTTRLGETVTSTELTQIAAFIEDASGMVLDVGNPDWDPDDNDNLPPAAVKSVVFQMVRRALKNPDGFQTESIGDYRYGRDESVAVGGVMMTKDEYNTVRRAAAKSNVSTVGVRRPNAYERQWISDLLSDDELVL